MQVEWTSEIKYIKIISTNQHDIKFSGFNLIEMKFFVSCETLVGFNK